LHLNLPIAVETFKFQLTRRGVLRREVLHGQPLTFGRNAPARLAQAARIGFFVSQPTRVAQLTRTCGPRRPPARRLVGAA